MAVIPASLKSITALIRRAEELEKSANRDYQIMAYYIRYQAISKGVAAAGSDPEAGKFLASQMSILESSKKNLSPDKATDKALCEEFTMKIFTQADDEDRAGVADKATAKLFYSAGTYFEALEFFGELDAQTQERKRYAKWKATEILNAIREGVAPTPGGFGETNSDSAKASEDEAGNDALPPGYDIPAAPSLKPAPSLHLVHSIPNVPFQSADSPPPQMGNIANLPQPSMQQQQPPMYHPPPAHYGASPGYANAVPLNNADPRVKDTVELANFAIAALKHNDINLAKKRLQEALLRLG